MRLHLAVPASGLTRTGNQRTAARWRAILEGLGHEVIVSQPQEALLDGAALLALHAVKSHAAIMAHRERYPTLPRIVALAGTDLYGGDKTMLEESMNAASHLVVLQKRALERLPEAHRPKARVIVQSVAGPEALPDALRSTNPFGVCVIGHLRPVKDPMRTAAASRQLPESSNIRVYHAGAILDEAYRIQVAEEEKANPRYAWLGELDSKRTMALLASCQVMVISSLSEGGAHVIGEAIVHGTPVLGSRVDGVLGLLDDDYPGTFPVGNTGALALLLSRCETDSAFLQELQRRTRSMAPNFHPQREREAWRKLLAECEGSS